MYPGLEAILGPPGAHDAAGAELVAAARAEKAELDAADRARYEAAVAGAATKDERVAAVRAERSAREAAERAELGGAAWKRREREREAAAAERARVGFAGREKLGRGYDDGRFAAASSRCPADGSVPACVPTASVLRCDDTRPRRHCSVVLA